MTGPAPFQREVFPMSNGEDEDKDFIEKERKRHEAMFDMLNEREMEVYDEIQELKERLAKARLQKKATDELEELEGLISEKEEELEDIRAEKSEHEGLMKRLDEEEEEEA